jgi:nucleotidyltransferase/DNA polymerase involved in DNA repair
MGFSRAWRLAEVARRKGEPEAVFVRGDRSLYRVVSGRIMTISARGADAFGEASIDEAYVDLSSLGDLERADAHARALKKEILEREGLTCSVGIGPNKLVAKIASDFRKPDGLTVVQLDEMQGFLDALGIRVIPGIGPKTEMYYEATRDADDSDAKLRAALEKDRQRAKQVRWNTRATYRAMEGWQRVRSEEDSSRLK